MIAHAVLRLAVAFYIGEGLLSLLLRWTGIFSFGIRKHSNYLLNLRSCAGMFDRKHLWPKEIREIIDLQKFSEKH